MSEYVCNGTGGNVTTIVHTNMKHDSIILFPSYCVSDSRLNLLFVKQLTNDN